MARPIIMYETSDLSIALRAIGLTDPQIASVISKGHEQDGDKIAMLRLGRNISQVVGHKINIRKAGTQHKYKHNANNEIDIHGKIPPDNFTHAVMTRAVVMYEVLHLRSLLRDLGVTPANIKLIIEEERIENGDTLTTVELGVDISSGDEITITRDGEQHSLSDDGEEIDISAKVPPRNDFRFRLIRAADPA